MTLGPRLGETAQQLGKPLMPHQQAIADIAYEIDEEDGRLAYDEVWIILMRQNGKTELAFPVMTHRMSGFEKHGPQTVIYTAQTADSARKRWRRVHLARLKTSPLRNMFTAEVRLNSEAILWNNGSIWSPLSTTSKTGGTGETLDLGMLDEAWSHEDDQAEVSMRPAMLTRKDRQLWGISMVPGPSRVPPDAWPYMLAKMKAGRARVEAGMTRGMAYFEFGADEALDPADPNTWWSCMPALGHTIEERAIRSDFNAYRDPRDFNAEYLSWIPKSGVPQWMTVPQLVWESLLDAESRALDPAALCFDVNPDRTETCIGMVGLRDDGDFHGQLLERRLGNPEWAAEAIVEYAIQLEPCAIAFDANGPAVSLEADIINGLAREGLQSTPVLRLSLKDLAAACGKYYDRTGTVQPTVREIELGRVELRRIHHIGQSELDLAVAGSKRQLFSSGNQFRWERELSGGQSASPLYCVTIAMWAGDKVDWAGGAYSIRSTLG